MANPFAFITGIVTGTAGTRSYTVTSATAAGDTLCVIINVNNTTVAVSACTDSQGNVYTLDQSFTSASPRMYMFRSPGATGGSGGGATAALATTDTLTLTTTAASANVELVGVDAPGVGAVDQIATLATGTSTSPSVSVTPTANNEILVGALVTANGGGAPTIASPFTQSGQEQTGSNPYATGAYDVLTGGSGVAQTFSATIVSANWRAGLWSFQPGASGSTVNLTVAQETVAAPAPTLSESLSLAVAQETVAAPAPTLSASLSLAVAQESVAAPAPSAKLSLTLAVAGETINALAPTIVTGQTVNLPVAQETISAPAPTVSVPPVLNLPVAQETIAALVPTVTAGGVQVYFGIGGIVH